MNIDETNSEALKFEVLTVICGFRLSFTLARNDLPTAVHDARGLVSGPGFQWLPMVIDNR